MSTETLQTSRQFSVPVQSCSDNGFQVSTMSPLQSMANENCVEDDRLLKVKYNRKVYVEWRNIRCFVPNAFSGRTNGTKLSKTIKRALPFSKSDNNRRTTENRSPPEKQVLHSITGHARSGEILALMGPSGSGKTTLISVIGGRPPKTMTTEGKVTFNGVELNKTIRRSIGYVQQDDLLYENLTVYETLYYAALLKLPKTMSRAEKIERVEAVISALGLSKCRDTLIGGGFRRGVSGGERKRVSVGHELLTNPSVLILDEPTSGLDSTTAMRLISSLKSLADGGRTVVTTIHQPSSRLFQQLTDVMLLSEGKVLYFGSSHLAVDWFDQKGFPLPYGVNVAEFILDISNGDIEGNRMDGESARVHLVQEMTKYLSSNPRGFTEKSTNRCESLDRLTFETESTKEASLLVEKESDRWGVSFTEQVGILLSRAAKNRRFDSLSYQNKFQIIGVSAIAILFWWQNCDGYTLLAARDISALVLFLLLYVQVGVMRRAIYKFPRLFQLLVRERANGMYTLPAFYIAESCCDIPLDYSIPVMLVFVVYWALHLHQSYFSSFSTFCVALLGGLNTQTIGLLLGATFTNPQTAGSLATVLMIMMMLPSGFWMRGIPHWIGWLRYVSPTYWAFRLALQIQFKDKTYYDCGGINKEQLSFEHCTLIDDLGGKLNLPFDVQGAQWPAILALIGTLFLLRVITYYILRTKSQFFP